MGFTGKNPRVRYPAIHDAFRLQRHSTDSDITKNYNLESGYILVLGNGLPHKNLGGLLRITGQISRQFVFAGVSEKNQAYWKSKYPAAKAAWIKHIADEDLPIIIRHAFCLAQPSTAEGYGYPPLEAMASGVPAIVSNIPVLTETTGGQALTADPFVPQTWLEALEALENKDTYESQTEKGLKWVEPLRGQQGWEKHLADIGELLKGL